MASAEDLLEDAPDEVRKLFEAEKRRVMELETAIANEKRQLQLAVQNLRSVSLAASNLRSLCVYGSHLNADVRMLCCGWGGGGGGGV